MPPEAVGARAARDLAVQRIEVCAGGLERRLAAGSGEIARAPRTNPRAPHERTRKSSHAFRPFERPNQQALSGSSASVSLIQPGFFSSGMCREAFCEQHGLLDCAEKVAHAVASQRPRTRYTCASVFGVPSGLLAYAKNVVPDFVSDSIVLTAFRLLSDTVDQTLAGSS